MGFVKFATAKIRESGDYEFVMDVVRPRVGDQLIQKIAGIIPVAEYSPNYLYGVSEAIHSFEEYSWNDNFDAFERDELLMHYPSFIRSGVYRDHDNDDRMKAVGICPDAYPTKDRNAIDVLMAVSWKKAPDACDMIKSGELDSTSMGVVVQQAICSICNNVARNEDEFCSHIKNGQKGQSFGGKLCFEFNRGLEFFENTLISPWNQKADPHAKLKTILSSRSRESGRDDSRHLATVIHQIDRAISSLENFFSG